MTKGRLLDQIEGKLGNGSYLSMDHNPRGAPVGPVPSQGDCATREQWAGQPRQIQITIQEAYL